ERWTSWREESGWIIKLEFTANEVDHDARWSFDPRRSALAPQNSDATQLSRQGSLPEGLIPRLRALDHSPLKDSSRFDSGAFGPRRLDPDAEIVNREARPAAPAAVQEAAIKRAPDQGIT
ncbi:septation protein SepH, partial [Enterococcus faecium]|uniref:septation protein SepH n=1 Tax=Enterococcus faecium TaxID=1352 RepID=UPI0034E972BE